MPTRRSFERRLRLSLVLFSLLPALLLVGVGTLVVSEAVALTDSAGAWTRAGASGRELLERAERSGDPALVQAARAHRAELSDSVLQSRRWEFLIGRALVLIPLLALLVGALLFWLAVRAARGMAHGLSRPVDELVGWAGLVARGEPLPDAPAERPDETGEFGVLREAFRKMVSELEASRARELEDERMRTWIAMARRVAHELKNPLTPMRLAVRTLERAGAGGEAEREALEVIAAESARLDELARGFAQFGRLPEGPSSEIDLREMMDYLLRTHLPPDVTPRLRAPVDLPPIVGNHDALSRAFSNLLLNAGDAVGNAGAVTVILSSREGHVEVRVLDSGPGIPAENLEAIWEPDFTTKSRGTGLGLALVRQTVQAHGGRVGARNRPEGGAEFRVLLPAAVRDSANGAPKAV
ncbi:MAG TPA: HAMP domain-containing sensor histidine kinase [Longimicrobiaceae bacterium]|jgi:nitrogen fixation/metabolism regulation signal transduction histidine kinase|nr:HAMP domain-containing sensor histidine kinase [Longimicrobiaceae bacterium]